MTTERKGLNFDSLSEFTTRTPKQADVVDQERQIVQQAATWDSRDVVPDVQLNLRAPRQVAHEFKQLCKRERRTYGDMLRVMMECFDRERDRTRVIDPD